jgi:hypothetical protein
MGPPEWEMNVVEMEMHNVELSYSLKDVIEHQHLECQGILNRLIEPESRWAGRNQACVCNGVATGKECNFVALPNKFFG